MTEGIIKATKVTIYDIYALIFMFSKDIISIFQASCQRMKHFQNSSFVLPLSQQYCSTVRGAPWIAAYRLHRHQIGAFSRCPVSKSSPVDRPIPTRPYTELRTWRAVRSGVICVPSSHFGSAPASPDMLLTPPGFVSHAYQPPLHPFPNHPILAMTYYSHVPNVMNPSAVYAQF